MYDGNGKMFDSPILAKLNKLNLYDVLIVSLLAMGLVSGLYINRFTEILIPLIISPLFAGLLDLSIKQFLLANKALSIPKTAIITGLFVAGVIDPSSPLSAYLIACTAAIISKYSFRVSGLGHLFNPAAFGIVVSSTLAGF